VENLLSSVVKNKTNMIFPLTNTLILLAISGLHFFWAFGGRWGVDASIPTNAEGKTMLSPDIFATLVVAFGLLAMALLHLGKIQTLSFSIPAWINIYGLKIIAFVFLLRAIGDFRYVGFFKKLKETKFAILDTKFYSPLCLLLSFNAFITATFL
jgi:hypothetical protein